MLKKITERFITESQSQEAVSNSFITLSFVFLGMMITALLYWSYQKTEKLFITIFSFMVFAYSLMMVIFITILRSKLSLRQFKIFLSASIFMCIIALILFVYFVIKAVDYLKRSGAYVGKPMLPQQPLASQRLDMYANTPLNAPMYPPAPIRQATPY